MGQNGAAPEQAKKIETAPMASGLVIVPDMGCVQYQGKLTTGLHMEGMNVSFADLLQAAATVTMLLTQASPLGEAIRAAVALQRSRTSLVKD